MIINMRAGYQQVKRQLAWKARNTRFSAPPHFGLCGGKVRLELDWQDGLGPSDRRALSPVSPKGMAALILTMQRQKMASSCRKPGQWLTPET